MKTSLILVDIHNDFCAGGALAVPEGDAVVAKANAALANHDLVVATQDWHPVNHGSFAANHPDKSSFQVVTLAGLQQVALIPSKVYKLKSISFASYRDIDRHR